MSRRRTVPVAQLAILILWAVCALHVPSMEAGQSGYQAFFEHVERAARFPRVGFEAPPSTSKEIRALGWSPTAMIPMPGLRLLQTDAAIEAQFLVAWHADVSPNIRKPNVNMRCDPDNPRDACVALFGPPQVQPPSGQNWSGLFQQLLAMGPCEDPDGPTLVVSDAGDLVMHVIENGRNREYFCNNPRGRATPAGRQAAALLNYLDENLRRLLGR